MGVILSAELERAQYWQEIRDYVNKYIAEEGWEARAFVRLMTGEEESRLRERGNNLLVIRQEDGAIELAVGLGKYLEFEEITKQETKLGMEPKRGILMYLWMAQMVCMGNNLGGCDS